MYEQAIDSLAEIISLAKDPDLPPMARLTKIRSVASTLRHRMETYKPEPRIEIICRESGLENNGIVIREIRGAVRVETPRGITLKTGAFYSQQQVEYALEVPGVVLIAREVED